jgi:hypothetical protein
MKFSHVIATIIAAQIMVVLGIFAGIALVSYTF